MEEPRDNQIKEEPEELPDGGSSAAAKNASAASLNEDVEMKNVKEEGGVTDEQKTLDALEELGKVQSDIDELSEKLSEEILKVEQRFNRKSLPHYAQRTLAIRQVPLFWVTTLINHPQISQLISRDETEEALHYLASLEVDEEDDIMSGFKLKFVFDENPFFEKTTVIKEFDFSGPAPTSKTSAVKWKPGREPLIKFDENVGIARDNSDEPATFFHWLFDNEDPTSDDIAEIIKDDIWPNPRLYHNKDGDSDDESDENAIKAEVDDEQARRLH